MIQLLQLTLSLQVNVKLRDVIKGISERDVENGEDTVRLTA